MKLIFQAAGDYLLTYNDGLGTNSYFTGIKPGSAEAADKTPVISDGGAYLPAVQLTVEYDGK